MALRTNNFPSILIALILDLSVIGCSTAARDTPSGLETGNYSFALGETDSVEHQRRIPFPLVRRRSDGKTILDFIKEYAGFEWVCVRESPAGIAAAMDYSVEGREKVIPILFQRSKDSTWNQTSFTKPHFSAEVVDLEIQNRGILIRLRADLESTTPGTSEGRLHEKRGSPSGSSEWFYSFGAARWILRPDQPED